jgi:hypothetical protein
MQTTTNNVKTETRWVITKDGIRMSYKEYMEMIKSERN